MSSRRYILALAAGFLVTADASTTFAGPFVIESEGKYRVEIADGDIYAEATSNVRRSQDFSDGDFFGASVFDAPVFQDLASIVDRGDTASASLASVLLEIDPTQAKISFATDAAAAVSEAFDNSAIAQVAIALQFTVETLDKSSTATGPSLYIPYAVAATENDPELFTVEGASASFALFGPGIVQGVSVDGDTTPPHTPAVLVYENLADGLYEITVSSEIGFNELQDDETFVYAAAAIVQLCFFDAPLDPMDPEFPQPPPPPTLRDPLNQGGPCSDADLAKPFGALDIADVVAFLNLFGAMDPAADLAAPFGTFDIADVVTFLNLFGAACP
ncbi:MAG: hypothetical protein CMJ31_03470 [Phycisphaerae bacterium]|nr:hypothetical protein [Phycisphaerae bacterium]